MVELYGWWKPVTFVNFYIEFVGRVLHGIPLFGLLSVLGILVLCSLWCPLTSGTIAASVLVPSAVIAVSTLIPIMWAYPYRDVMIDSVWGMSVFILVLIWSSLTLGLRAVSRINA
jgi:hypothetical protein